MAWSDAARAAALEARRRHSANYKKHGSDAVSPRDARVYSALAANNARKAKMIMIGHSGGYYASRSRLARALVKARAGLSGKLPRAADASTRNLYARMGATAAIRKSIDRKK